MDSQAKTRLHIQISAAIYLALFAFSYLHLILITGIGGFLFYVKDYLPEMILWLMMIPISLSAFRGKRWAYLIVGTVAVHDIYNDIHTLVYYTNLFLFEQDIRPFASEVGMRSVGIAIAEIICLSFVVHVFLISRSTIIYSRTLKDKPVVPRCAQCGYDLRGTIRSKRSTCPECGTRLEVSKHSEAMTSSKPMIYGALVTYTVLLTGSLLIAFFALSPISAVLVVLMIPTYFAYKGEEWGRAVVGGVSAVMFGVSILCSLFLMIALYDVSSSLRTSEIVVAVLMFIPVLLVDLVFGINTYLLK